MKTTSSAPLRNSAEASHPPLARDAQGNLVAVPEGAASWCLKRDTGGRPRMVVGQDRLPARFSLDTTAADLEAMLGAGTFRVYALTEVGEVIDYVTTVNVGREAADEPAAVPGLGGAPARGGGGSDLRFALETILQMARAQSDSLRAVAEAQADWVKGLATAKALPRNAAHVPAPLPPTVAVRAEDEDDEEEELEDEPPMAPWMELVNQIAPVVQTYGEVLKAKFSPPPPPRNAAAMVPVGRNAMIHLSEINASLTPIERKFLNLVLRGQGGAEVTDILLGLDVEQAVGFVKDHVERAQAERKAASVEPPSGHQGDFMAHVMAGAAFLSAEERMTVMRLLPGFPPVRLEEMKAQLLAMTPEEAAAWLRQNLDALRAEVAS